MMALSLGLAHKIRVISMGHHRGEIWVWVNTYRYIFSGMNIHLPAILGFTRYRGFDPSPYDEPLDVSLAFVVPGCR